MTLVDHAVALERLRDLMAESSKARGQLVRIQGGVACGKTELLHEFTHHAAASGALVLSATASQAESDLQAGLIDQFFKSTKLPTEATERVQRTIRSDMSAELPSRQRTAAIVHEVSAVLLELSETHPVVIAVDDAQFADHTSLQLLLHVVRRMRSMRIMMVLTEWDWPRSSLPRLRAELTRCPHHAIRIGPLSLGATAELVTRSLGQRVGSALTKAFHDLTGGNPALVKALTQDHSSAEPNQDGDQGDQHGGQPLTVGFAFGEAIVACLHGRGAQLLAVARGIGVLGDRSDPELIGRLMGMRGDEAERAIHALNTAGLLLNGRFSHPVAKAAVLGTLSPDERTAVHIRAAELLYQRGVSAIEVARQIIASGQVAESWMIPVLRTAAEQAVVADDSTMAIRCLETALHSAADKADRLTITAALARVLWRVNPSATASYMPLLQEALRDGSLQGQDVVTVVRHSLWNGDAEGAVAVLQSLPGSFYLDDAQLEVELRLMYQWYYGSERGQFQNPNTANATSREPWSLAADQLATVWNHKDSDTATDSAERILQSCQLRDSTVEVVACAILVLASGNQLERAVWWCEQLIEEAQRRGAVVWQALLSSLRAGLSLRRGKVLVAATQAEEALGLLPVQNWGVMIGYPLSILLSAYTALGRHEAAADVLECKVPEAMFDTVHGLSYLHARGHHYLATDRVLAATSDFQRCGQLMRDWSLDVAAFVPWRSSMAETYLQLGRVRVARDLVKQQLEQTRTMDDRVRGISLRVLAACSELGQRTALLRQAVEYLETAGDRVELVRALEELSRVYQQLNEFDRARLLARRAAQENKACHSGATPIHKLTIDREAEAPQAATSPRRVKAAELPVLSDAQRRVAELAALGHTNQEIGRRLYITVSTVEQHLTRVFRKLGVNSRNELPMSLHDAS